MTDTAHVFFATGSQYYIAGRYAVFAALNPVAGNLLHHAVEQFLKGGLSKSKALDELKRLNHNLPAIWAAFKVQANDQTLARFDEIVSTLHEFEELRYPDSVVANGMACMFGITKAGRDAVRNPPSGVTAPPSTVPQYSLCLEEIDELVGAIFVAASRNPKAYLQPFKPEANEYLIKENMVTAITG